MGVVKAGVVHTSLSVAHHAGRPKSGPGMPWPPRPAMLLIVLLLPPLTHPALGQDWPPQALEDDASEPVLDPPRHRAGLGYRLPGSDPPVAPPAAPARTGQRYRCDNPSGYYPYINACRTQWRSVSVQNLR